MNGQVIEWIWVRIGNIASSVSSLGQIIPQDELARVIQGILWVIIVFLLIGIIDIPLLLCLGTIIKYVYGMSLLCQPLSTGTEYPRPAGPL